MSDRVEEIRERWKHLSPTLDEQEIVATAPSDIRFLLSEIQRLQAELDQMREQK